MKRAADQVKRAAAKESQSTPTHGRNGCAIATYSERGTAGSDLITVWPLRASGCAVVSPEIQSTSARGEASAIANVNAWPAMKIARQLWPTMYRSDADIV